MSYLRWIVKEDEDAPALKEEDLLLPNDVKLVEDYKGNQLLLFASPVGHPVGAGPEQGAEAGGVRRRPVMRGPAACGRRRAFSASWARPAYGGPHPFYSGGKHHEGLCGQRRHH